MEEKRQGQQLVGEWQPQLSSSAAHLGLLVILLLIIQLVPAAGKIKHRVTTIGVRRVARRRQRCLWVDQGDRSHLRDSARLEEQAAALLLKLRRAATASAWAAAASRGSKAASPCCRAPAAWEPATRSRGSSLLAPRRSMCQWWPQTQRQ